MPHLVTYAAHPVHHIWERALVGPRSQFSDGLNHRKVALQAIECRHGPIVVSCGAAVTFLDAHQTLHVLPTGRHCRIVFVEVLEVKVRSMHAAKDCCTSLLRKRVAYARSHARLSLSFPLSYSPLVNLRRFKTF